MLGSLIGKGTAATGKTLMPSNMLGVGTHLMFSHFTTLSRLWSLLQAIGW
jgi:hypothetical protein